MPEQNEKSAWTPGAIRTMNHAQYMVWEMGQSRWPGLPPYHSENVAQVVNVTREQYEQHGDSLPVQWAPHFREFDESDGSMTAMRLVIMKDGSVATSREYLHPGDFSYYVWETAGHDCDAAGMRRFDHAGTPVEAQGGGPISVVQQW